MISPADDYPLHQTSRPFRDPGTDLNLYDRFFFGGYPTAGDESGAVYFAAAFGTYPGRNIVDGAFSVIVDGIQHNVRGSRLMGDNRLNLRVGPINVEIVEPLKVIRVHIDAPDAGISAHLEFNARGPAFEEPHYRWAPGNLTVFDITRLTQNGTWTGWIQTPSRRIEVTPENWRGTRDRSWGIRPIGTRATNLAPDGPPPSFYWLWAPLNMPDQNVLFDVNETADGTRWHENASVSSLLDANGDCVIEHGKHTYSTNYKPATRHASSFIAEFDLGDRTLRYNLVSKLTFFMSGIGYGHPIWGHGVFVGPDEQTHDTIVLAEVDEADPLYNHVQILSEVTRNDSVTGVEGTGMGILEMLISGPHAPSGFTSYTDTAS
jgi:hypothetical protein